MSEIERIARKLSRGREAALRRVAEQPSKPPRYGAQPYLWLYQRGFTEWDDMDAGTFRATDKGRALLAVRAHLERNPDA